MQEKLHENMRLGFSGVGYGYVQGCNRIRRRGKEFVRVHCAHDEFERIRGQPHERGYTPLKKLMD